MHAHTHKVNPIHKITSFWVIWLLFADIYALEVTSSGFLYGGKTMWWGTDVGLIPSSLTSCWHLESVHSWVVTANSMNPGFSLGECCLLFKHLPATTGQQRCWEELGSSTDGVQRERPRNGVRVSGLRQSPASSAREGCGMWSDGEDRLTRTAFSRRRVCFRLWERRRDRSRDGGARGTHRLSLWVLCLVTDVFSHGMRSGAFQGRDFTSDRVLRWSRSRGS